ncbi:MAG: ABC transporter permease [Bacteroidales bacterium]|nr:ABC transporter permease [Bacteroidales bacterium]
MSNITNQAPVRTSKFSLPNIFRNSRNEEIPLHPFRVIVEKEISDQVRSWRFIILIAIIVLTTLGSLYTSLNSLSEAIKVSHVNNSFLFLKLFTVSNGTLPSFFVFITFLGPLLGIGMGFDAINSEHNRGTMSHILAQPIHRDYLLNAKFIAALTVITFMFFALGFLVMGLGLISIGIPPTPEEFWRIIFFIILSIVYVAFWLNLSILFSVKFRQPATSALTVIAIWLFFTVFYPIIVNLISKSVIPGQMATSYQMYFAEELKVNLMRIVPNQLFSDATTTLLVPTVRSLGPLTMQQVYGTIPGALPLGQSLLLVWPQVTALIAGTILCFVISYVMFMRREIRSR